MQWVRRKKRGGGRKEGREEGRERKGKRKEKNSFHFVGDVSLSLLGLHFGQVPQI